MALVGVAACIEPSLRICGDVACAHSKVCDGRGGCATPEQLTACSGLDVGSECAFDGRTGTCTEGGPLLCQPYGCGNGFLTADEVCDDSNTLNGDDCSADCRSLEVCGNGVIDSARGEQCDDMNSSNADSCHADCLIPRCGDGVVDVSLDEDCDAAAANSVAANASCRPSCQLPRCGDGVRDDVMGEICDDGNLAAGDGCRPDCRSNETCGNGELDFLAGEQCDDGNTGARDGCTRCLLEDVIAFAPGVAPPARTNHALAYDGARERVVMFGGFAASNETWEWDGAGWTQMRPRHAPSPRRDVAMAYDPLRRRVLLFGGVTGTGQSDETWEWDGVDWTQRVVSVNPPPRAGAALTWDGITGEMLLVGGESVRVTHTWNGSRWLPRPHVNPLVAGQSASAAYNLETGEVILVIADRMFSWDGSEWNNPGAGVGIPTAVGNPAIAWHAGRGHLVLWPQSAIGNVLYELIGSQWVAIPGTGPSARDHAALAYDVARQQLVLHGGDTGGAETWLFDTTWMPRPAFAEPSGRRAAAIGYDPIRGRTVLYGARGVVPPDLWEFDGRRWNELTGITPPVSQPQPGGMDYDRVRRKLVMHGGSVDISGSTGDVVAFDGVTWSMVAPPHATPTLNLMVAFDSTRDRLVSFGGVTAGGGCDCAESTTWLLNGMTWTSHTTGPPERRNGALAHDPVRGRTILFGGTKLLQGAMADTWEWDGTSWTERTQPSGPPGRRGNTMTFHADRGRIVMVGGAGTGSENVWEWTGTRWFEQQPQPALAQRYRASLAYHAAARSLVFVGGDTAETRLVTYRPHQVPEACTSAKLDYDNDGLAGCADPECWARCAPLCTPGLSCDSALPRCGDGMCGPVEDCKLCPGDCGACPNATCGNYHCEGNETATTCPTDC